MEEGYVKKVISENIGIIEFYHPKSNSLPSNLLNELNASIKEFCNNDEVKVLILKSAGEKVFCAGASFDELLALKSFEEAKEFFSGFAKVILTMKNCGKFILTRVQGKAVGGAVGLIAASDYVFASTSASVKLSEISIGIGPFVIAPAVERKIGKSAFAEMTINAEWKSASWTYEKGLFNKLFDDVKNMDIDLSAFAKRLSSYSNDATQSVKKIIWEGTENWDELLFNRAELSGKLALSETTRRILLQFKNRK